MRRNICSLVTVFFVLTVMINIGCTTKKDEALPLNAENITKFIEATNKAANKVNMSDPPVDKIIKAIKIPLESSLGYDFDKSFRYFIVHPEILNTQLGNAYGNIMFPAQKIIFENLNESLQKKLISPKTFELVSLSKDVYYGANDNTLKGLEFAAKCQANNNGICTTKKFIETLKNENIFPENKIISIDGKELHENDLLDMMIKGSADSGDTFQFEVLIENKLGFLKWGGESLILKPDGSPINSNGLMSSGRDEQFVVNQKKLEAIKKYLQLSKE